MSKELLLIADSVAHEKAVPRQAIFEALEQALAGAKRRQLAPEDALVRVSINQEDGSYEAFRRWEVVADDAVMDDPARQVRLMDALEEQPDAAVGEFIEQPVDAPVLGRVAAQTAKQIIHQRVRDSERTQVREAWQDRIGELIMGTVKRYERNQAYVDLGGNAEGVLSRAQLIPGERLRVGERVRAVLVAIDPEAKGPQLILSRTAPALVQELFTLEVPEIGQGLIEIMGCARDPGQRAKLAVQAHDRRTDPIGACIGMRGSRVQAVMNELAGERVDIVLWHASPAEFVVAAMAPAEIEKIIVDETGHRMDLGVPDEKLAMAIGRGGQNIRLASQLTGWQLTVMGTSELDARGEAEAERMLRTFVDELEVDEEIAGLLVDEGFTTIEEVAYVPLAELLAIDGFDEDIAQALQERARDALLVRELRVEEADTDLAAVAGAHASALVAHGVADREALADLSVDELLDLNIEGLSANQASTMILAARQSWFEAAA